MPDTQLPIVNYRLTVRDPRGALRHERYDHHADPALQVDIPSDGLQATHNGYADCLELTFKAIWATLGARGRDLLELDTLDTAGTWTRRWAGVIVTDGNAQVTWGHSNFKAAGLRKRLTEVRVPANLAEGDVGAQAREAVQAVIASGQLGAAVVFDAALIPDAGVQLGVVQAARRTLADILDYLATQGGRSWGVNADRKVFWRASEPGTGDVITLTETFDDPARAVLPTFEDGTAEELITRILFHVGNWEDGSRIEREISTTLEATYGTAWKEVPLDPTVPSWATVLVTVEVDNVAPPTPEQLTLLVDRRTTDGLGGRAGWDIYRVAPTTPGSITLVTTGPMQRMPIDARWENVTAANRLDCRLTITAAGSVISQSVTGRYDAGTSRATIQDMVERRGPDPLPAGTRFQFDVPENVVLSLAEARPEIVDDAMLTALATFHARGPSRDPANVRVPWPVTPQPWLNLTRLDGSVYEAPVELTRLLITVGSVGVTQVQTGQRVSAEEAAARYLARRALEDATLSAIRSAQAPT